MINLEDWAEIRRLHRAEGMPVKAIVRRLGLARNTVRAALRSEGAPNYERERKGAVVDAVEPKVLELLRQFWRPVVAPPRCRLRHLRAGRRRPPGELSDPRPDGGRVPWARHDWAFTRAFEDVGPPGEWNALRRSGGAKAAEELKGLRFLLLRNWENLTARQRSVIRSLDGASRRLLRAWQLREE